MNDKNTGGPAFPVDESALIRNLQGMTLRDYFAAKAMQGDLASLPATYDWVKHADDMAVRAYYMADAMLKARAS